MASKPILFNTEMIQAILDGRKSMTRRVIKDKDITNNFDIDVDGSAYAYINPETGDSCPPTAIAKYQVGDILWVRETWRIGAWNEDIGCIAVDYKADNYARREWIRIKDEERFKRYWIESTDDAIKAGVEPDENGEYHWEPRQAPTKWRPSIHMPREAARIFLKVTNVRVERLKKITLEDIKKEGIKATGAWDCMDYLDAFAELWDSIYAEPKAVKNSDGKILYYESYPWEDIQETKEYKGKPWYAYGNPWVFVYEFEG